MLFPTAHGRPLFPFVVACCVALSACGQNAAVNSSKSAKTDPVPSLGASGAVPSDDLKKESEPMLTVQQEPYGSLSDGTAIQQYLLQNKNGVRVRLINWGATVTSVETPDKSGNIENITLTLPDMAAYEANPPFFGCTTGRFANRIAKGKFTLDGNEYSLATNNSPNHLHGGNVGFNKKVWNAKVSQGDNSAAVHFTYTSPDGEEGYPGELTTTVVYSLNNDNELSIDYTATTDAPTVLNLTNHCYWNLGGVSKIAPIEDHLLTLECDKYIPVDETGIPTGELASVTDTCMDFTKPETIGKRIDEPVNGSGGYDHCYVVNGTPGQLRLAAKAVDPKTGRSMEILTTEPGIQFYTGNFLAGTPENGGASKHGAFCLETQHFPDSPNQPQFPTTVLRPGETYRQTTVHKFGVEK